LIELIDIGSPSVSPDGKQVAIETRQANVAQNVTHIRWRIVPVSGKGTVVDAGDGGEPVSSIFLGQTIGYSPPQFAQWSPDSRWIAYPAKRAGSVQIWRTGRDGGQQEQLTHQKDDIQSFAWSSDGARLIFATSSARREFERGLEAEAMRGYLYDARFAPYYSRAPMFDPEPAHPRVFHVRELSTVVERLATRAEIRELVASERREQALSTKNLESTHRGVSSQMRISGCDASVCTGYFRGAWNRDHGRRISFLRWVNGRNYGPVALYEWQAGSRTVTEKLRVDALFEGCSLSGSKAICAMEAPTMPRRLVALDLDTGIYRTVYDPNPVFQHLRYGDVTALTWHDRNGIEGFGHFVKPIGYHAGQRSPLIIVQYRSNGFLRGGVGDEYPIPLFAAAGFAVLSFHRPDEWEIEATVTSREELERRGWIDYHDRRQVLSVLEAGIDHLVSQGFIDPARIGITGLSDGGITVAFALIHAPRRFAAAAASWTAWNPLTYYLAGPKFQPRLRTWEIPNPDADTHDFWRGLSVGLNAARIDAPLLLQVADREILAETHTVTALSENHKAVEMHVFPDEYHIKTQPIHRYSVYRRNAQWFQFWLQNLEVSDPVDERQYARWRALRAASSPATTPQRPGTPAAASSARREAAAPRRGDVRAPAG
jgi:dipeptidyl aminopeptidase/acylaminoacyl peptidase